MKIYESVIKYKIKPALIYFKYVKKNNNSNFNYSWL